MKKHLYMVSDHGGYDAKDQLYSYVMTCYKDQFEVVDLGPHTSDVSVDYPLYAEMLAIALAADPDAIGVALCGTGIGISIALNRHSHVRAALCHIPEEAQLAREHNNANVIVFGGRIGQFSGFKSCLDLFLKTPFSEEERHQKRIRMLSSKK